MCKIIDTNEKIIDPEVWKSLPEVPVIPVLKPHATAEEIQDYWRQMFAYRYKEAFGIELDTEQLVKDYQTKMTNGDYGFTLNYYGIKSPWL